MEYTKNYQLPTWVKEDRIRMEDFNNMTGKLDEALGKQEETLEEHTAVIAGLGNCELYEDTYIGTGTLIPVTHTFPGQPLVIMVAELDSGYGMIAWSGMEKSYYSYGSNTLDLTWSGNTVTWFNGNSLEIGLNAGGRTYQVVALINKAL